MIERNKKSEEDEFVTRGRDPVVGFAEVNRRHLLRLEDILPRLTLANHINPKTRRGERINAIKHPINCSKSN